MVVFDHLTSFRSYFIFISYFRTHTSHTAASDWGGKRLPRHLLLPPPYLPLLLRFFIFATHTLSSSSLAPMRPGDMGTKGSVLLVFCSFRFFSQGDCTNLRLAIRTITIAIAGCEKEVWARKHGQEPKHSKSFHSLPLFHPSPFFYLLWFLFPSSVLPS
jgi:hypothetical protein